MTPEQQLAALLDFKWGPYQHWKGGLYYAFDWGRDAETGAIEIQYVDLHAGSKRFGQVYHRPIHDWLAAHPQALDGIKFRPLENDDRTLITDRYKIWRDTRRGPRERALDVVPE